MYLEKVQHTLFTKRNVEKIRHSFVYEKYLKKKCSENDHKTAAQFLAFTKRTRVLNIHNLLFSNKCTVCVMTRYCVSTNGV